MTTLAENEENLLQKAVMEAHARSEEGQKSLLEVKEMLLLIREKYGLDSLEWILELENDKHLYGYIKGTLGQKEFRSPDLLVEHPDYWAARQGVEEGFQVFPTELTSCLSTILTLAPIGV